MRMQKIELPGKSHSKLFLIIISDDACGLQGSKHVWYFLFMEIVHNLIAPLCLVAGFEIPLLPGWEVVANIEK
jgi:hypothetical protein